jgi:hypothetical protein
VFFSALCTGLGFWVGYYCRISAINLMYLRMPLVIGGGLVFVLVGINSTRMSERFSEVDRDLDTRKTHWEKVIETRTPDNWRASVLGEGMGAMPKLYYLNYFSEMVLPSMLWQDSEGRTIVELGVGGYPFHQKLSLLADREYKLVIKLKAAQPGDRIAMDICRKHILFSERWQPDCVQSSYKAESDQWAEYVWKFNSGHLGREGWLDWPPTLQIHNVAENPYMLDSVELFDDQGRQIIKNPHFDERLAYWLWSSDFEHLPWHSKQLLIHIWLEQGWVGLTMFVALVIMAFVRQMKLYSLGETVPIALVPCMIAILGLGLTDTFIDEPQVSLLMFAILFAALQWPYDLSAVTRLNRDSRIVY